MAFLKSKLSTLLPLPAIENKKRDEIFEICKPFSEYKVALYKCKKSELLDFHGALLKYKEHLDDDYKCIQIGDSSITLDDEQHKIIISEHTQNVRILASAGSGKTTTILCRIKYLIDNHVAPSRVLILTFNVDACNGLKDRIKQIFGFDIKIDIRTIDSFCASLKQKYGESSDNKYSDALSELGIDASGIMDALGDEISALYEYVFFDEFQDVSNHHFKIIKSFADNGVIISVIGDDCQNIYSWRGSQNYYIINLDKLISKPISTFTIATNYRSTKTIVDMANQSISHNIVRIDKKMIACNSNLTKSVPISLCMYNSKYSMFDFIVRKIKELGVPLGEVAILSRTRLYLKEAETALQRDGIPYTALITDQNNGNYKKALDPNSVAITTIFKSKGLEWSVVFLVGLNDKTFPSHMNSNLVNIEEERRLFYVGVTRPKKHLFFVAEKREQPLSRFLREIIDHYDIYDNLEVVPKELAKKTYFKTNNDDTKKTSYSVMDVITSLQGTDIKELKSRDLLGDTENIEEIALFEGKLGFNSEIKKGNFEADFGQFCDQILTRNIMKQNGQPLKDNACLNILNSVILSDAEMHVYNVYNIRTMLLKYGAKALNILAAKGVPASDYLIIKKLLSIPAIRFGARKANDYPSAFMDKLRAAYEKYSSLECNSKDILEDIYYVSLCRQFVENRRRLAYRNIYDLFMIDFAPIFERIQQYSDQFTMREEKTICKKNVGHIFDDAIIGGEIDIMTNISNGGSIIDLKCSEGDFKLEFLIQVLMYFSLLRNNHHRDENVTSVGIFNLFNGIYYEFKLCADYKIKELISFIEDFIKKDQKCDRLGIPLDIASFVTNSPSVSALPELPNIELPELPAIELPELSAIELPELPAIELPELSAIDIYSRDEMKKTIVKNRLLCFDVETNIIPGCNDIIQLSYIIFDFKTEIKRSNKYIKNRLIDKKSHGIHHITKEMLAGGSEFADAISEFITDLQTVETIVGHNINCDIKNVRENIKKYSIPVVYDPFSDKQIADTMNLCKKMPGLKCKKLGAIYERLMGKPMVGAHDALVDCEATMACYFKLMSE